MVALGWFGSVAGTLHKSVALGLTLLGGEFPSLIYILSVMTSERNS